MSHKDNRTEGILPSTGIAGKNKAKHVFASGLIKSTMDKMGRPVLNSPSLKKSLFASPSVSLSLQQATGNHAALYQTFLKNSFSPATAFPSQSDRRVSSDPAAVSSPPINVMSSVNNHSETFVNTASVATEHKPRGYDDFDSSVDPNDFMLPGSGGSSPASADYQFQMVNEQMRKEERTHPLCATLPHRTNSSENTFVFDDTRRDVLGEQQEHNQTGVSGPELSGVDFKKTWKHRYSSSPEEDYVLVGPGRDGNGSPCSTCSLSVDVGSRCSSCDGCSSVECACLHHRTISPKYHVEERINAQSSMNADGFVHLHSDRKITEQKNAKTPQEQEHSCKTRLDFENTARRFDTTSVPIRKTESCSNRGDAGLFQRKLADHCCHEGRLAEHHLTRDTWQPLKGQKIGSEQILFLMFHFQFSKYKQLMEDYTHDKQVYRAMNLTLKSQGKTVACLIQAVFILTSRLKSQNDTMIGLQSLIQQHQEINKKNRRQQRLVYCMLLLSVMMSLLSIKPVQHKIIQWLQMFHIGRYWRSFLRFRRMVSENWRNVPSVLTSFWRIFGPRT